MADELRRSSHEVEAGERVYTPLVLRGYDRFVLGFSNRFVWRCRSSRMLERLRRRAPPRRRGRHPVVSRPLQLAGRRARDHPPRPERELAVGGIETDPPVRSRDGPGERVGSDRLGRCELRLDRGELPLPLSSRHARVEGGDSGFEPPSCSRVERRLLREHDSRTWRPPQRAREPSHAALQTGRASSRTPRTTCRGSSKGLATQLTDVEIEVVGAVALFADRA